MPDTKPEISFAEKGARSRLVASDLVLAVVH
jgi:hypothetical protein